MNNKRRAEIKRLRAQLEELDGMDEIEMQGLGLVSGATESDLVRRWKLIGGVS